MYNNESAAVTAMQTTLISIQRIRSLLASEAHSLSREVYVEVDRHLASIEYGLSQEVANYGAYQYTPAPHLHEDDESERASFWRTLVTRVNGGQ
jgi:hypothetical protein